MQNQENLTEERLTQNLELFKKKLTEVGVDTTQLIENFGSVLKNATYSFSNTRENFCGEGFLLNTILRILTPTALGINKLLPENQQVENNTLIKVCLLHQIAKAVMVTPSTVKWEIERGNLYKFIDDSTALRMGMRSIIICLENGIQLTPDEIEAISNLDRLDDKQVKCFSSPMGVILRQAIELTDLTNRKK